MELGKSHKRKEKNRKRQVYNSKVCDKLCKKPSIYLALQQRIHLYISMPRIREKGKTTNEALLLRKSYWRLRHMVAILNSIPWESKKYDSKTKKLATPKYQKRFLVGEEGFYSGILEEVEQNTEISKWKNPEEHRNGKSSTK